MDEVKQKQEIRLSMFQRGKDTKLLKIFQRIDQDKQKPWYVNEFTYIAKEQTVRLYLKKLQEKGFVEEIKDCYPHFWRVKQ